MNKGVVDPNSDSKQLTPLQALAILNLTREMQKEEPDFETVLEEYLPELKDLKAKEGSVKLV